MEVVLVDLTQIERRCLNRSTECNRWLTVQPLAGNGTTLERRRSATTSTSATASPWRTCPHTATAVASALTWLMQYCARKGRGPCLAQRPQARVADPLRPHPRPFERLQQTNIENMSGRLRSGGEGGSGAEQGPTRGRGGAQLLEDGMLCCLCCPCDRH